MYLPFTILLPFVFTILSPYFVSLTHSKVARLGISTTTRPTETVFASADNSDLNFFYYHQNLDHSTFTPKSYQTFRQRYVINAKHWAGSKANAPILAFLGEEASIESDLYVSFFQDNGPRLKALLVYVEHRSVTGYYGKSVPFGSAEEALKNASTLGYLNAAQALADYAAILMHVKEKYSAKHSPIIVVGGSYGGMLAAWFRLKYPHIALGALASSAPLLYFEDTRPKFGYYHIITKVFKETSKRCYKTIRKSWKEIDRVAAKSNGLLILSKKFKTCAYSIEPYFDIKDFLDSIYAESVQFNGNPGDWVATLCNAIDNPPNRKNYVLDRIFAGVVAYFGNQSCYDTDLVIQPSNNAIAWSWQGCSEIVIPIGHDKHDTMFQTAPFNMTSFIDDCKSKYGVSPRPHWITTYFGIQDIKLILRRFGSNIIFSNGLADPYSVGGVLENVSGSVVAIKTLNGTHCQDLSSRRKDDPKWLVMQREKEIKTIESWISTYQKDLRGSTCHNKLGL
ncbi:lysosomal Pro-X carboxypeptidase-like [Brassica napus]|uniref:lysosomal Pro-X carboxypeptidase-like n=1 Tax=Brassica napus TaxID=3708 RepID=UPI00207894CD|nr:lysosomal Pro-X carboxypeptidase-like [Brassica napus]